MKLFHIAYYVVLRNFRDRKTLMQMLLFPIILIFILGSALSNSFNFDNISKLNVAYLNEDADKGPLSSAFTEFLKNDVKELLEIKEAFSYEDGKQQVQEGKIEAFIYIDKDFTKNMLSGDDININVYNSVHSSFRASMVKNIVDSFVDGSNAYTAAARLGGQPQGFERYKNLESTPISAEITRPKSIDYYAVTMLIMAMMFGTMYGGQAVTEDKLRNTYIRLNTAPIKQTELVLGQILGTIVTLFMQALIIIGITKYIYKANWGNNMAFVLFVCFSVIVLAVSLGILVFKLMKTHNAANGLLTLLVNVFTFISGGYVPIDMLSENMERISVISPNYLAQQAIFNSIFSGSGAETQSFLIIIWVASAVMFALSVVAGRRVPRW